MSLSRKRRRRLRDFPFMLCCAPHLGRRTRPLPVTLKRLFAARFVFILGMLAPFLNVEAGASVFPAAPVAVFWTGGAEQGPGAGFLADGAAFVKIGPGSRRPQWQFAPLCLGFRPNPGQAFSEYRQALYPFRLNYFSFLRFAFALS